MEDGETFLLTDEEVFRYYITVGRTYSQAQWEKLLEQLQAQRAYQKGLDLVLFRKNTREELLSKLKAKGFSAEEAAQAVERLEEAGYVNDFQYAQSYVRQHRTGKYTTLGQIRQELLKKGVAPVIIDDVLSVCEPESEEDELEKLKQFINNKYYKLIQAGEIDYNKKMSIQQALYRKGYSVELIQRAVNEIWK